jgi:hypothetical protein
MGCDDLDVDLVASFDFEGGCTEVVVNLRDPQWNFEGRVNRLLRLHSITRAEAEDTVRSVIATKEHGPGVSVTFATLDHQGKGDSSTACALQNKRRCEGKPGCVLLSSEYDF